VRRRALTSIPTKAAGPDSIAYTLYGCFPPDGHGRRCRKDAGCTGRDGTKARYGRLEKPLDAAADEPVPSLLEAGAGASRSVESVKCTVPMPLQL